jgi:hypothetical protein
MNRNNSIHLGLPQFRNNMHVQKFEHNLFIIYIVTVEVHCFFCIKITLTSGKEYQRRLEFG